jgi:RNA polymerase sigma factor (TIGR02999 family)
MRRGVSTHDFTVLLQAWGEGDAQALDRLTPLVYHELRRIARGYMAHERPDHTLQATALVNEAYLRLIDTRQVDWHGRAHFLAICARAMRQILVDHARSRASQKHGGGQIPLQFDEKLGVPQSQHSHLLELDDALKRLAEIDPRKSQVVELRFFGGLSIEETAEALKASPRTVKRDWQLARAWLYRELSGKQRHG